MYKEKSFSNAAKNLFIAQSSLSLTVKRAEERIGMPVFDRSTYPIQLTEFGKLYIQAVEEVRRITGQLTDYIDDVDHLRKGHLSVGAGNFFSTYYVAPAIAACKERYPNISVNMMEGRTLDLEPQLSNGTIDVLMTNAQLDASLYHRDHLFNEHLIVAIPQKWLRDEGYMRYALPHTIFAQAAGRDSERDGKRDRKSPEECDGKGSGEHDGKSPGEHDDRGDLAQIDLSGPGISLKILTGIPFIGMRRGNDLRKRTADMMESIGLQPDRVLELDQTSTAFRLACSGMGACIIGDTVIRKLGCPPDILLFKIDHPLACREVSLYTRSAGYTTRTVERFTGILRQQR